MLTYADECKYLSSNNVLLGRTLGAKVPDFAHPLYADVC
jgi:hypothetical protein